MTPYYSDESVTLYHGDALEVLDDLLPASLDAVVTDPPYQLGFMGRSWDSSGITYNVDLWLNVGRVLKPGGHLLAFGGTRTAHRLICAIEDAGFEIRDSITWIYGSGFPKSLDVSKAIDKAAGAEREVVGTKLGQPGYSLAPSNEDHRTYGRGLGNTSDPAAECAVTAPATDDAARWSGWGTALKPAHELIVVARKPLAGTVSANVLAYGTGAINVDGCRVAHASDNDLATSKAKNPGRTDLVTSDTYGADRPQQSVNDSGRWPSNVVLDGYAAAELDRQSSGGASRFFPVFRYEPKADSASRPRVNGTAHPTVKPLDLMRWLVRLVTQPGGVVLDPFAGSGTTAEACIVEGFRCVLVEKEGDYLPLIVARLSKPLQPVLDMDGAE